MDDIVIMLLLFADDMAIIGKTPIEIHLENLSTYCNHWGLHVNTVKTKQNCCVSQTMRSFAV